MGARTLTRRDGEAMIVRRAWTHPDCCADLLGEPKGMVEKSPGQKMPAEIKVAALPGDEQTIRFVMPPKPANADQLLGKDLERVASGVEGGTMAAVSLVALGATGALAGTVKNRG